MLFCLFQARKTLVIIFFYKAVADIKKVLGDIQATVSDEDINRVISACKGKKVHELIAQGVAGIGASSSAPSNNNTTATKAPVAKE